MVDYVVSQGKTVALEPASADLDLFFKPHPVTGDITVKKDTDAVRRAVKNIILTNKSTIFYDLVVKWTTNPWHTCPQGSGNLFTYPTLIKKIMRLVHNL